LILLAACLAVVAARPMGSGEKQELPSPRVPLQPSTSVQASVASASGTHRGSPVSLTARALRDVSAGCFPWCFKHRRAFCLHNVCDWVGNSGFSHLPRLWRRTQAPPQPCSCRICVTHVLGRFCVPVGTPAGGAAPLHLPIPLGSAQALPPHRSCCWRVPTVLPGCALQAVTVLLFVRSACSACMWHSCSYRNCGATGKLNHCQLAGTGFCSVSP
jgi:hypothetical protein